MSGGSEVSDLVYAAIPEGHQHLARNTEAPGNIAELLNRQRHEGVGDRCWSGGGMTEPRSIDPCLVLLGKRGFITGERHRQHAGQIE